VSWRTIAFARVERCGLTGRTSRSRRSEAVGGRYSSAGASASRRGLPRVAAELHGRHDRCRGSCRRRSSLVSEQRMRRGTARPARLVVCGRPGCGALRDATGGRAKNTTAVSARHSIRIGAIVPQSSFAQRSGACFCRDRDAGSEANCNFSPIDTGISFAGVSRDRTVAFEGVASANPGSRTSVAHARWWVVGLSYGPSRGPESPSEVHDCSGRGLCFALKAWGFTCTVRVERRRGGARASRAARPSDGGPFRIRWSFREDEC